MIAPPSSALSSSPASLPSPSPENPQASTVLELVRAQAARHPDRVALRRVDGSAVLRYRELLVGAASIAATLRDRRVARGSQVFVLSDNGPHTYLAVLACAELGAIAVMVDGSLPSATIARFGEITGPSAILISSGSRTTADDLPENLRALPALTVNGVPADAHDRPRQSDEDAELGCGREEPLAMIFTSGTTGEPKAVLLANRTFFAIPDILEHENLDWISWVEGETTYSPLPATHIGGLWWILTCLTHGGLCVTGGETSYSMLDILGSNSVASACLVPTLLSALVGELKATGATLPALRLLGYGGSRAIAADVAFIESVGVRTAQVFGLSETGCTALCLPTGAGSIAKIEAGAVGRPYPGVEVFLSDPADGARPGTGPSADFGTLWIKSPANMLGYWNNPERTAEVLLDGWVNTGDLLQRHDDGFFYIKGRSSEMIISGGINVAPDEVDRIAEQVDGVGEAACFEIIDEEFGALVGLAVVPSAPVDSEQERKLKQRIAAHFRTEAESAARPARIHLIAEIPRTQSGKVMRASLAAVLTAGAG